MSTPHFKSKVFRPIRTNVVAFLLIVLNIAYGRKWVKYTFLRQSSGFRWFWSSSTIQLTWNTLTNRLFVTYAVFPPPERQQRSVGSPAALCGAMWPGWELEDTYLMWGSADCIVSTGPRSAELGNFRDTICLKQIEMAYSLHSESLQSVQPLVAGQKENERKVIDPFTPYWLHLRRVNDNGLEADALPAYFPFIYWWTSL